MMSELFDWLVDGARGSSAPTDIVERIGRDLCAVGVPVDRLAVFVRTLHPSVAGRSFRWVPGGPATVSHAPRTGFEAGAFQNSPIRAVVESRRELRARLSEQPRAYPVFGTLAEEGFRDYLALPLEFMNGEVHVVTFVTKAEQGFSEPHLASLRTVVRPLARIAEIFALRRVASTLLSTYVGRNAGDRILAGRIQRGDHETIRAVIWFSDLRGFTEMSSSTGTREVIETLNAVFDCQVAPIEAGGGEVLKFIGDGLLAIFPLTAGTDPALVADRALVAADEALAAVAALTPARRIGLALHIGDVGYGNIGGSNRLDFTAIGPAVNLASRLEALASKLGEPLVLSEELAGLATRPSEDLGAFELKGLSGEVRAFAPR